MRFLAALVVRQRRVLLFVSWGATLLVLIKLRGYQTFLRPEFGVLLKAGYLILVLLVVAELFRGGEARPKGYMLLSPAILLVPVLYMLNARGAQLDGYAFQKRMLGTPHVTQPGPLPVSRSSTSTPSVPASGRGLQVTSGGGEAGPSGPVARRDSSGALELTILDLYRATSQYEGEAVALVGLTNRNEEVRKEFGPTSILAFRFRVTCCAADAQPFAVVVQGKAGQLEFPDNTWVEVRGRFRTQLSRGEKIPVIEDATLSPTTAPERRYLY